MKNSPNSESSPNSDSSLPGPPRFYEFRERVRYSETDQMGVAHNKSYFEWFEVGRTEYCREAGLPYRDIEARGYYLVVAEASCRYRRPLRYDQEFIIRVALSEFSPRKFVFQYELRTADDGQLVASGHTIHVVTNSQAVACALPDDILALIKTAAELHSRPGGVK